MVVSGGGTSSTGDAGNEPEGSCGCFWGVDCFQGGLLGPVVLGAGVWNAAAQRGWVCCLASWKAAASLALEVPSSSSSWSAGFRIDGSLIG